MGRRDRHERLRSPLRRGVRRRSRTTRRALHVRLVAVGVRGCEPARASTKPRRSRRLDDPASEDIIAHYGALKARCEDEVRAGVRASRAHRAPRAHRRSVRSDRPLRVLGRAVRVSRSHRRERRGGGRSRRRRIARSNSSMRAISRRGCSTWRRARRKARSTRALPRARGRWATLVDALDARARAPRAARPWRNGSTTNRCFATASRRGPGCRCGFPRPTPSRRASWNSPARARWRAASRFVRSRETIDDTAAWLRERDNSAAWRNVLSAAKEREILADAGARPARAPSGEPAVR